MLAGPGGTAWQGRLGAGEGTAWAAWLPVWQASLGLDWRSARLAGSQPLGLLTGGQKTCRRLGEVAVAWRAGGVILPAMPPSFGSLILISSLSVAGALARGPVAAGALASGASVARAATEPTALAVPPVPPVPLVQTGEAGPRVVLEAADGTLQAWACASFTSVQGDELVSLLGGTGCLLRFVDVPGGELEPGPLEVRLSSGARLLGWPVGGAGESLGLTLRPALGELAEVRLSLPVEHLVALEFPARRSGGGEDWGPAPQGDRLYHTRAGSGAGRGAGVPGALDRVDGFLEEFTPSGLLFSSDLGTRTYGWSEVGALFLEVLDGGSVGPGEAVVSGRDLRGTERNKSSALAATIDLRDGGRLGGELKALGGAGCSLQVPGCGILELPAELIDLILLGNDQLAFLSDKTPTDRGPLSPFGDELGMTWPARVDRAVSGVPLLVSGRRYSRGLGVHAPSALTFAVEGWSGLRGSVALDDSARLLGIGGQVVFRVTLDGRELWSSPPQGAADGALALPTLDLTGGRELVLAVDQTADGFAGDRAAWLELLLVR